MPVTTPPKKKKYGAPAIEEEEKAKPKKDDVAEQIAARNKKYGLRDPTTQAEAAQLAQEQTRIDKEFAKGPGAAKYKGPGGDWRVETPEVKEREAATAQLEEIGRQNRITRMIQQGIMGKSFLGTKPGTAPGMPGTIPIGQTAPGQAETGPLTMETIEKNMAESKEINALSETQITPEVKDLKSFGERAIVQPSERVITQVPQAAVSIFDDLSSLIQSKESFTVRQAKDSFNSANAVLINDIEAVKTGDKNPMEVTESLRRMDDAIGLLEAEAKGLSTLKLTWFRDNGVSIKNQIEEQKSILEEHKLNLIKAAAVYEQNTALSTYGL